MLRRYENCGAHYIVHKRKLGAGCMGPGKKPSHSTPFFLYFPTQKREVDMIGEILLVEWLDIKLLLST
jgi:hypothetical protein